MAASDWLQLWIMSCSDQTLSHITEDIVKDHWSCHIVNATADSEQLKQLSKQNGLHSYKEGK